VLDDLKHYRADRDGFQVIDGVIALLGFLALLCLAFIALSIGGCAAEPFWHTDMPGYAAPVKIIRTASAEELSMYCRQPRAADAGCSIRLPFRCMVYLGPRADVCEESHEVNGHCKGLNHRLIYGIVQECAYDRS
jgi:hypothetical protein